MKKVSVRKLSVLGMVLMAASAVTAAVLPSKASDVKRDGSANNATLISASGVTPGGGGVKSCVPDVAPDVVYSCHLTDGTLTGVASEGLGVKTQNNTSLSITDNDIDTTSIIIP